MILIEESCLCLGDVAIGQPTDHEALGSAERTLDLDFIAHSQQAMGFRRLTIHRDLPALAGLLSIRPRLEEARHVKPHVEANRFDGAIVVHYLERWSTSEYLPIRPSWMARTRSFIESKAVANGHVVT